MQIRKGIIEAIGNTPLIKLEHASKATGCIILGKAEFMNPGGSVKDRAGRQMIVEAEKRGELRPGGLVVEATAGNTGIGLAVVASARGYRTLIVIPETQSQEKKDGQAGEEQAERRIPRSVSLWFVCHQKSIFTNFAKPARTAKPLQKELQTRAQSRK